MKGKVLILILVLSLAINGAVLAAVGYHYYRNNYLIPSAPCPVLSPGHHLYQDLGLSNEQLAGMAPLAQNFHSQLEKLASSMEGKKERLVDLLSRKDVDSEKIAGLRREMAGIQDEIQKEVIGHILETRKILDARQQQHFFDLMRQSMRSNNAWLTQENPKK
jgi:Spy/CpxP family protein refolding chaperone